MPITKLTVFQPNPAFGGRTGTSSHPLLGEGKEIYVSSSAIISIEPINSNICYLRLNIGVGYETYGLKIPASEAARLMS